MKFINLKKDKCDNCYKCLRVCPTKAISFNGNDRMVIDDLCIKCGLCQASCPQEALEISSQIRQFNALIENGEQIAVSLAPSFAGAFAIDQPKKIIGVLKALGVIIVEETAVGAELVADCYEKMIDTEKYESIITTCCPSANYLIEEHYPSLIPYMLPIVSPMIAHGFSIKKRYGDHTKVVFMGPCLAKMAEAEEMAGAIDVVLTFDELQQLIKKTQKSLSSYKEYEFDINSSSRGKAFPLGVRLKNYEKKGYRFIHATGIDLCRSVLEELHSGQLKNVCVEINICNGSCVNGPDMPKNNVGRYVREMYMKKYVEEGLSHQALENDCILTKDFKVDIRRTFTNKKVKGKIIDPEMIQHVLFKMGKYSKKDELNCNACGYKTCYDKAKAVCYGYSDIETCLPSLQKKAESMQSVMIQNSPNAVILLDLDLNIKEVNPKFIKEFNSLEMPVIDMPVKLFMEDNLFCEVINAKKSIFNERLYVDEINRYFLINIVYLFEEKMLLAFLTDISADEMRRQEFNKVKEETLLKTQEVIDKQMRVAQEIASLLGETTAETKMSLRSLNDLVRSEQGGF